MKFDSRGNASRKRGCGSRADETGRGEQEHLSRRRFKDEANTWEFNIDAVFIAIGARCRIGKIVEGDRDERERRRCNRPMESRTRNLRTRLSRFQV